VTSILDPENGATCSIASVLQTGSGTPDHYHDMANAIRCMSTPVSYLAPRIVLAVPDCVGHMKATFFCYVNTSKFTLWVSLRLGKESQIKRKSFSTTSSA
jgi:hypothetical protein